MKKLQDLKDRRILLDTNVLIKAADAKKQSQLHTAFPLFVARNTITICDTVYYEFLRNCNMTTYRNRVAWLNSLEPAIPILCDNQKLFENVWCLYLYALRHDPRKLLSIEEQDIHIATCAIDEEIDTILTENYRDFPPALFEKTKIDVSSSLSLYVM